MHSSKIRTEPGAELESLQRQLSEVKHSTARRKNLLAAIPHGVAQVDLYGMILYANPAYHEIFEYENPKLIGTSIIDRMDTDETRKRLTDFLKMLRQDQPLPEPFFQTKLTKSGKKKHVKVDYSYDRDDEGHLISFTYVVTDITERKLAEAALKESRALLSSFIDTAPVGMAIFDSDLRYKKINSMLADINGIAAEEHIDKRPRDILPGSLGLEVEKRFKWLLKTGESILNEEISGETLSQRGVTRHWLHSYFPIFGSEKSPTGIGVTVVEITKIKKAEEQHRQSQ